MNLNRNTKLIGQHAFLSPSNYHWLDYDEDKLTRVFFQKQQAALGDRLHQYAQMAIELKQKQPDNGTTMSRYVNDAIGFRMQAEQPLFYSVDCFGTADALGIRQERQENDRWVLRVSDLKTGTSATSMKQPLIYAGIFFFEYGELFKPQDVKVVLRIYQNDQVEEWIPDLGDIVGVMSTIRTQAARVAYLREED